MQASVVIPTYNRRETVTGTLRTLFQQNCPAGGFEIIVIVDGSTDGTLEAIREMRSPWRLRILEQGNRGPGAARNAGIRAAEGDLVIFLDDDMRCDPGFVRAHVARHERSDRPIIGFGAIFLSADTPCGIAAECFNREMGAYYLRQRQRPSLPWPAGTCVIGNSSVLRKNLLDAGGFDERFRRREDTELATRLLALGVQAQYIPTAVAYQYYTKNPRELLRDAEEFAVGDHLYVQLHPREILRTFIGTIASEPSWKRLARRILAQHPNLAATLLVPAWWLGEKLAPIRIFRRIGARALQTHRGVRWYRKVLELEQTQ